MITIDNLLSTVKYANLIPAFIRYSGAGKNT
jgi:hypothetical protein